eukprot:scaffold110777_cov51-Attheya_sp.AAC.5
MKALGQKTEGSLTLPQYSIEAGRSEMVLLLCRDQCARVFGKDNAERRFCHCNRLFYQGDSMQ